MFQKLLQFIQSAAIRLRAENQSPLYPLLWLCSYVIPISLGATYYFAGKPPLEPFCPYLLFIGIVPIPFTCLVVTLLLIFRSRDLRSDSYNIQEKILDLLMAKGGSIPISAVSLNEIANQKFDFLQVEERVMLAELWKNYENLKRIRRETTENPSVSGSISSSAPQV